MNNDLYAVILHKELGEEISVGSLGDYYFDEGYYVYVGSAKKNILSRIKRHMDLEKNKYWHIDYLRGKTSFGGCLIFSRDNFSSEMDLVNWIEDRSSYEKIIEGFGSSDTDSYSHLLFSEEKDGIPFSRDRNE